MKKDQDTEAYFRVNSIKQNLQFHLKWITLN